MAASAEHPADTSQQTCQGATLLGYFWNLEKDALSTNKNRKINLHLARRWLRPSLGEISEAEVYSPPQQEATDPAPGTGHGLHSVQSHPECPLSVFSSQVYVQIPNYVQNKKKEHHATLKRP